MNLRLLPTALVLLLLSAGLLAPRLLESPAAGPSRIEETEEAVVAIEEQAKDTIRALETAGVEIAEQIETALAHSGAEVVASATHAAERVEAGLHRLDEEAEEVAREVVEEVEKVARKSMVKASSAERKIMAKTAQAVRAPVVGHFESALSGVPHDLEIEKFPPRPKPLLEMGNPYFGSGYIGHTFQIPTGAWWQPSFFLFGQLRSGFQTFDPGPGPTTTQWVTSLSLYANLNLTPTERLLFGVRPLDRAPSQSKFTEYNWRGEETGFQEEFNFNVSTLFFTGNFASLFPTLDDPENNWAGFDFSLGRQGYLLQDGLLINDTLDLIGITRTSMYLLGANASTVSLVYAWNGVHRGDGEKAGGTMLVGALVRNDYSLSTVELDLFYSSAPERHGGDGLFLSLSAIQRIGKLNTSFRLNGSLAPQRQKGKQTSVNDGLLLFSQLSTAPPGTDDVLYLNSYAAIGRYTSASRAATAGGALSETGILFAATGLGDFGSALNANPIDTVGFALGYQHFFDEELKKQIVVEVGGQTETRGPVGRAIAAGVQYQMSFHRHWVWVVGAIGALQKNEAPRYGLRSEIQLSF